MLVFAIAVFTLVALMGLGMILELFKGQRTPKIFALLHAGFALLGSGLVVFAALGGDNRVWPNIGMAVVIIVLGGIVSLRRHKGKSARGVALAHAGLAVACYLLLIYVASVSA